MALLMVVVMVMACGPGRIFFSDVQVGQQQDQRHQRIWEGAGHQRHGDKDSVRLYLLRVKQPLHSFHGIMHCGIGAPMR
jgi:hypothetical protein